MATLKDAWNQTSNGLKDWYNSKIASTPVYQQVINSDTYASMTELGNDAVSSLKTGWESFKQSQSGQRAVTMSNMFQQSEFGQKAQSGLSNAWNTIMNADITDSETAGKLTEFMQNAANRFNNSGKSDSSSSYYQQAMSSFGDLMSDDAANSIDTGYNY